MRSLAFLSFALLILASFGTRAEEPPRGWANAWPATDFSKSLVAFDEIMSGGPPKDGIPAIDQPVFAPAGTITDIGPQEPVITVREGGAVKAYPVRILMWHEIVNDTVGGLPLVITYCPLCNAALVYERTVDGEVLDFGTSGKLRHSDLVMYDRQTESWWQQFTGESIVGARTGTQLTLYPARLESYALFKERYPDGRVLIPSDPGLRDYGRNPYPSYDMAGAVPFLFRGEMPEGIEPMARVVAIETADGPQAWSLTLLREVGEITTGDILLSWQPGQASALDTSRVSHGWDVGNVTVQRLNNGQSVDLPYDVTFAFAFHAFRPDSPIHTQ